MKKSLKLFTTIASVVALTVGLVGCGKSGSTTTDKKGGKTITVWSHLTETEVKALDPIAQEWAKSTGNTVKLVADKSKNQEYTVAAQSSKGPDIMYGVSHNDIGVFQKAGIVDEVPAGVINDSDYASKDLLNAVTWDGKKYAVPLAMETYALFYNTDLVKTAPKTVDDLVAQAKTVGFQYDINNFYYTYSWIASYGGYVFKNTNGTLDPKDIGLGNSGAVAAYQFIQDLVVKDKLMKGDIKGDDAKGAFQNGKTGFYISGPWDVSAFKTAGTHFAVAPLPALKGTPMKSFMGVQAAFVSSKSKNKTEAWDLMKYLISKSGIALYKAGSRIPALNSDLNSADFKSDAVTAAFAEQAKAAEPMPNITEMNAVWTPAANNLSLLTQGKQDAAATGKSMAAQVADGVSQMK